MDVQQEHTHHNDALAALAEALASGRKQFESLAAAQRKRLAALERRIEAQFANLAGNLAEEERHDSADVDKRLQMLREERDELVRRLAATETTQTNQARAANDQDDRSQEFDDLQRRYEMAMDDIRDLKHRNTELENKTSHSAESRMPTLALSTDWESQKRRMLESLEEEDDNSADRQDIRLRMEEVISATEKIVLERDREIAKLKGLLEQQTSQTAVANATARQVTGEFDRDEVIHQERDRLKELQDEWEDKLRQAEIQISVERAQIARARAELEEQQRIVEQKLAEHAAMPVGSSDTAGKPKIRRWLAILGLTEEDRQGKH